MLFTRQGQHKHVIVGGEQVIRRSNCCIYVIFQNYDNHCSHHLIVSRSKSLLVGILLYSSQQ